MIYTLPAWIPAIAWLIAASAVFSAILLRRKQSALFACLAIAAFSGAFIAPILSLDRVVLDDEKLEQTTGFWWSPTVKGFRLADVSHVLITTARDRKNRSYEVWVATFKNGGTREIDPGDLWEMNGEDIGKL